MSLGIDVELDDPVDGVRLAATVVVLADIGQDKTSNAALVERLRESGLRIMRLTYDTDQNPKVTADQLLQAFDQHGVKYAHVIGIGAGADVAWWASAQNPMRFTSLFAVGKAHPKVVDSGSDCPSVQVPTTLIVGDDDPTVTRDVASASAQFVHSDFRLTCVDGAGIDVATTHPEVLSREVSMRTAIY